MTPPELMFFRGDHRPGLRERLWLRGQLRKIGRHIQAEGWIAVPFQLPGDRAPRFFYTVGFDETLSQPELILFDQPAELVVGEFQTAFEQLQTGELALEDGMTWVEQDGMRCILREVHPEQIAGGWFGLARERRRALKGAPDGLRAFQLVSADKAGFLPWEAGYDEAARQWQPALWEPPAA